MFTEAYCIVSGRVQGVGYRDFVAQRVCTLQLVGWIRNTERGTVELLVQGVPDNLRTFIEDLHEGSVLARVEGVSVEWRSPEQRFDDFEVLF